MVPASDRPPLLQALSVDPDRRFRSCVEFIQTLIDGSPDDAASGSTARPAPEPEPELRPISLPQLNKLLGEVVAMARGAVEVRAVGDMRYVLHPGCMIEHHCRAGLLPTAIKVQLHAFRQQWGASLVATESHLHVFHVPVGKGSVWSRLLGRTSALQVTIRFLRPENLEAQTPVTIEITPAGSLAEQAAAYLEDMGPKLLDSVRRCLQAQPERRRQERLRFDQEVPVSPVFPNGQQGKTMMARAVNISTGGMRLLLPCQPPTPNLVIELTAPSAPAEPVAMSARIVSAEQCPDGTYDVGVCFKVSQ
jgi:hypothetical protein